MLGGGLFVRAERPAITPRGTSVESLFGTPAFSQPLRPGQSLPSRQPVRPSQTSVPPVATDAVDANVVRWDLDAPSMPAAIPTPRLARPTRPANAAGLPVMDLSDVPAVLGTPTGSLPQLDLTLPVSDDASDYAPGLNDAVSTNAGPLIPPAQSDVVSLPPIGIRLGPPVASPRAGQPVEVPSGLLNQYAGRIQALPEQEADLRLNAPAIPADSSGWWRPLLEQPFRSDTTLPVDVSGLVIAALEHSPTVSAIELSPEIRRTAIFEEEAAFDWATFAETTYDDINEPVGNTLTTGGPDRFKDRNWSGSAGVRRQTTRGGEIELSQQVGWQQTNSRFFIPDQQGNSRLSLSFTQPLLSQSGQAYNTSRTVLARLAVDSASNQSQEELQQHLLDVATAYWDLYRARAIFLQRQRVLGQAESILAKLEGRQQVDALPRQVLRARAAVASRQTEIVRAAMEIRNAESSLRRLVGDPQLAAAGSTELLPTEHPIVHEIPISLAGSVRTALMRRPDIRRSIAEVRSAGIRLGMAENELMPRLDLVFNTYISGLQNEGQIGDSILDSWSNGRPSFASGLLFEVPLHRRAAKARQKRRELELLQATRELEASVEATLTEVELAVREADTSHREMLSQFQSLQATSQEAEYLTDRWLLVPGSDRAATILLEDLIDAQARAADDESAFVAAQVNYLLALTRLRRTMGTLMQAGPECSFNRTAGLDEVLADPGATVIAQPNEPVYE